jgi:hypothetical protein
MIIGSTGKQVQLERSSFILPINVTVLLAEKAWELVYSHMAEFLEVFFSQLKEQLKDHRRQVAKQFTWSAREFEALAHDQCLFPRQMHNCCGEPVFNLSLQQSYSFGLMLKTGSTAE